MESDDGFEAFGAEIKSDPLGVLLAKWRRDSFIAKLERLPDVIEVIPSGSLARGTHIGPVHDVDLIVVFDKSAHPDYGTRPESARAALTYLENRLLELMHPLSGTEALLKGTEQRTHVVNCYGGSAGRYSEFFPSAPPVDVMPAVREKPNLLERSHLLVPELAADGGGKWAPVDPETFMRQVEQRQREWKYFTEVIKMVRAWAELNDLDMKTVAIEAMVLMYCPRPRMFETLSRGEALARFFEAASKARITKLEDPAGRCGEIDKKMDYGKLRRELKNAAGLSRQAMDAEFAWKNRFILGQDATDPAERWRQLFGDEYPAAREPFWRAPASEPWFDTFRVGFMASPGPGDLRPNTPPDGPNTPPDGPNTPPDGPSGSGGRDPKGPDDLDPREGTRRSGGFFDWAGGTRRAGNTPNRPRPGTPRDPGPARPPGASQARPRPAGPGRRAAAADAAPVTNLWTAVFGSAATVSVPLTFG
jgi:hypothetical protein